MTRDQQSSLISCLHTALVLSPEYISELSSVLDPADPLHSESPSLSEQDSGPARPSALDTALSEAADLVLVSSSPDLVLIYSDDVGLVSGPVTITALEPVPARYPVELA